MTVRSESLIETALEEARQGLREGGIPIGAAFFDDGGQCVGRGRNRLVQEGNPAAHAETDALRAMGRGAAFPALTLVTTLMPCWMCAGMVRQFRVPRVVVGDAVTFDVGTRDWLVEGEVEVTVLNDPRAISLMREFIDTHRSVLVEDAGGWLPQ